MKKFGFGSKKGGDDGGDDDASRSALFGRKKSSQPPAGDNPYAQAPPANDPYAQSSKSAAASAPYQQQRPGGFQSNPYGGGGGSSGGLPGGPGPRRNPSGSGASTYSQPPPPYGGDANERSSSGYGADRYGADRYGASGGYGDNRYDNSSGGSGGGYGGANRYGASSAASARGPGGYGGLGRTNSNDTDAQRDQLFSGAQQRNQQRQQGGNDGYGQDNAGGSSAAAGAGDDPYGGYGAERELTEEEIEAQEVRDVKKQIQDTRQESINSLQRSIALAHQAADTGINTMNILARDEERLNNTEKRLDEAANYNKIGAERAKKLKNLNRSMFAVHVNNPFTNSKRTAEYEQNVIDNHRAERELRNETRKNGWDSSQQMEHTMRGLNLGDKSQQRGSGKSSAAEKSKYVFLDEDDDENNQALDDEATIDRQMDELSGAVSVLNRVAKAQTQTVQRQIVTADRINEKTDMVDDGVRLNRARLDRIK